jgi:hypothetical protein
MTTYTIEVDDGNMDYNFEERMPIYIVEIDNGDMDYRFGGAFIDRAAAIAYADQFSSIVYKWEMNRPVSYDDHLSQPDIRTGKIPT